MSGFSADTALITPGTQVRVWRGELLRVYMPVELITELVPAAERAEACFAAMCARAGYRPTQPLTLVFAHRADLHNGFSMQIPLPAESVDLSAAVPSSGIFAGAGSLERTLIHEFAHHISNDRNHGFRNALETVFGRVVPSDPLSLLLFYLSTPAHQTMPAFWHEGLAQWAETAYADPRSVWRGRGYDSLTHMVWRLDTAAGGIPPVGDWRYTHVRWPYGNTAYLYGLAYLRYLVDRYQVDPWTLIDDQARRWPFVFDGGSEELVGKEHHTLIAEARAALFAEQTTIIDQLRTVPTSLLTRLTPEEARVAAPAWLDDERVICGFNEQRRRGRLARVHIDGKLERTGIRAPIPLSVRGDGAGGVLYNDFDRYLTATLIYRNADGRSHELGEHLLHGAMSRGEPHQLAAIRRLPGGGQELVLAEWRSDQAVPPRWRVVPVPGQAWSPAWRGDGRRLACVGVDERGSTLWLLDPSGEHAPRALVQVAGRLLHPAWSADGRRLFYCADHTGVLNAWCLALDAAGEPVAEPRPVTNTLGGVMACVPSPDGRRLALIDHDENGPFLAMTALDERTWPASIPTINLTFPDEHGEPLPVEVPVADRVQPLPSDEATARTENYHGLLAVRPRYWSPSLAVTPWGGVGIVGLATDPLLTHLLSTGIGVGDDEEEFVGYAGWCYGGWQLDLCGLIERSERTYGDEIVVQGGRQYDYTETVDKVEGRVGYALNGLERRFFAYAFAGAAERERVTPQRRSFTRRQPYIGSEIFAGATIGYDDRAFYPDGFSLEDGFTGVATFTHTIMEDDRNRDRLLVSLGYNQPIIRSWGHQLAGRVQFGWSDGDEVLQETFAIGGQFGAGLPRGYFDEQDHGAHLAAGSIAYRFPVWRHFKGFGSTPFVHRQLVVEAFYDAAKISEDHPLGDEGFRTPPEWYRSAGVLVRTSWEFWNTLVQPAVGLAQQLDGDEDLALILDMGVAF